jgi:DNA-directed RNA polymerase specialized sigma24 family protein
MLPAILGYGWASELLFAQHVFLRERRREEARASLIRPSGDELREFMSYARLLGVKYGSVGNGADASDVEQIAMIAAWDAVRVCGAEERPFVGFVKRRMRWRVIDFVRLRTQDRQRQLERRTHPFEEGGGGSTD